MLLEIRLFAGLHKYVPGANSGEPFTVDVTEGCDGLGLLRVLNIPEAQAFVLMVNGSRQSLSHKLAAGDRVGIFSPVGGG